MTAQRTVTEMCPQEAQESEIPDIQSLSPVSCSRLRGFSRAASLMDKGEQAGFIRLFYRCESMSPMTLNSRATRGL